MLIGEDNDIHTMKKEMLVWAQNQAIISLCQAFRIRVSVTRQAKHVAAAGTEREEPTQTCD